MGVLRAGFNGTVGQSSAQVIDGSLKFDGPSNQHLTRTPSSSGNTKTWTVSFWTKLNDTVGYQYFASAGGTDTNSLSGNDFTLFQQDNGASTIYFQDYRSSTTKWAIDPTDVFRDPNGWYHFLIQLDTPNSTVKLYVNNRLITSGTTTNPSSNYEGYWNSNAKHRISDGTYGIGAQLSQFYNIDGVALGPESFGYTDPLTNTWRPKKYSGSFNAPAGTGTVYSANNTGNTNPGLGWDKAFNGQGPSGAGGYVETSNGATGSTLTLNVPFTTLEFAGNGSGFEFNGTGVSISGAYTFTNISSSITSPLTSIKITQQSVISAIKVDGVILENPAPAGVNGFYLPMDGNSPIGEDKSGNGNGFTLVNFSGTSIDPDVLKDSPSGAVSGGRAQTGITTTSSAPSNYATMNPLQMSPNRTPTISDGNLSISLSSGSSEWTNTGCTMSIGSGKYYWEVQFTTINGTIARVGVADSDDYEFNRNTAASGLPWLGSGTGKSWSLDVGGNTYHNGSTVNGSYTSTIITSDIIGVLLDLDNNTLSFSKNGTNLGVAHSNVTSDFVTPGFGLHGATTNTINVNFGQKPFKYAPPQGFLPLNSASATSETVITRPDQFVGVTTYTGNGGTQSIETGHKFDFVWIKTRSGSGNHHIFDVVRGVNKSLHSDTTASTETTTAGLTSFDSNGFSIGNSNNDINGNGITFVSWNWKAGGSKNTFNKDDVGYASAAAAGLTGGSTAPNGASVGTKQGFSIIKWTGTGSGTSLGHGLGSAPDFVIVKSLANAREWLVWHSSFNTASNTDYLYLNTTGSKGGSGAGDIGIIQLQPVQHLVWEILQQ